MGIVIRLSASPCYGIRRAVYIVWDEIGAKLLQTNSDAIENCTGRYALFIPGETIDLCVPDKAAVELDGWTDWFNKIPDLQATQHGIFPNHKASQLSVLESLYDDDSRIVLLVCDKKTGRAMGVISLQNISFTQKSAEIAINIGAPERSTVAPLASLEAMALITEHGFEQVGLQRIFAGQAYPRLSSWNKMLELIGYKTEGIIRQSFVRGQTTEHTVAIACHYSFYSRIREFRGSLWGSKSVIKALIKRRPKNSQAEKIDLILQEIEQEHFEYLF